MIQERIKEKLQEALSPTHLEVINESYMHNVPEGSESHFKVIVVSKQFEGLRLLGRHRAVNAALAQELANDIHALAVHTYTQSEWQNLFGGAPVSPPCQGGSKSD
ncbi:transcriptional regulator BolA [Photobacterium lipolyticum]|uniref:DNA-binding transcriptional regulator BolA n=1 Tax=Photobacterium lipolyticum TaxID=266810 RepID=A0A2T3MTH4_9GAMM|nr:transcriptional regulator BolA [Photobacterium lipolyticum]PSW02077.1 BolA family transcriptional regulator [Photobacterium lipolyticum]